MSAAPPLSLAPASDRLCAAKVRMAIMADAEPSVRKVGIADLRGVVVDSDELRKGTELFDRSGIKSLARYANKLFGEAAGSGPAPYRVTLTFAPDGADVRAKCTCPAAFSRPFCKHAAALLVAWARAPEAFVATDGPPGGDGKKRAVKRGKVDDTELRKQGVEQIVTLVRELAAAGVASLGQDRLPQVIKLGENLREYKLRRLAVRTLDIAALLGGPGPLPAREYVDLVTDALLTARKLGKHLASGEPLDPRHVEELVGKTWQKGDLSPVAGLDVIEYAFITRTTNDQFVIDESRFFDVASGAHYSEKQIDPVRFRSANGGKASRAGSVLAGLRGGRYPGYPPFRIKIADLGDPQPIDHAALARAVDRALPDVASALAALQEHRRDVFAPDLLPVAIRVDTLFARGGRMQAVDASGAALHLPTSRSIEDRMGSALGGAKLAVLLGDVSVEAALPTLTPLAAIVEGPLGFELRSLGAEVASTDAGAIAWARAAGASTAAVALAEVREELVDAFVVGLASLGPRTAGPLAERLRELGMAKQADLLASLARAEPEARLDDFVKLYHVLGVALLRLTGATEVDRSTLVHVPTYESVFVARPDAWLPPERVVEKRAAGAIGRYEAAVHYAHHYESLPAEELATHIYPTWADGSASPYVVRALSGRRDEALAAAKIALSGKGGRVAKITALRVLAAVGGLEAERVLHAAATGESDIGLRAIARDARDTIEARTLGPAVVQRRLAAARAEVAQVATVLASAPTKDLRAAAIARLVQLGHLSAIPALRQALLTDAAEDVREEAAIALALLGDTEMVDTFVAMLARRGDDEREAKRAAHALGMLGDVRGLRELCAAFVEGYRPHVIGEALRSMGAVAVEPLIAAIEQHPKLADRKPALTVLSELSDLDLAAVLVARVHAHAGRATFDDAAALLLKLASVHVAARRAVAEAVLASISDPDRHKALVKSAKKALC